MRVLITAGGTRSYLDEVRYLGNISTGRFGSEIALECLAKGAEVVHLHAEEAQVPYRRVIDLRDETDQQLQDCQRDADVHASDWLRYREVTFDDIDSYAANLRQLLVGEPFDIVMLVAAVSDYAGEVRPGKIASDAPELRLRMSQVPKMINQIKDWAPKVYQVGFKLSAGASPDSLIATALESGRRYGSDVTVANELRLIQQGNHTIHIVRDGHPTETYDAASNPAKQLVARVFEWCVVPGRTES